MIPNPWIGTPQTSEKEPIYIDEFMGLVDRGQAAVALRSDESAAVSGRWRLERGVCGARKGQLLRGVPADRPPILRFDLPRGTYAIALGAFAPLGRQFGFYVRLSDQPHFTYLQTERHEPAFEEMHFTTAELTGQSLEVACFGRDACLDYIRLTPVVRSPLPPASKSLIGILDFADDAGISRPVDFEAGSAIHRHADVGYDTVMWKAYAVRCEYHTKIGEVRFSSHDEGQHPDNLAGGNAEIGHVLQRYDTMRQAVDEAKKRGVRIFGWARINNEFSRPNHQFSADTWFHKQNPDKFQQHKDGRRTCKLSFAYPEVRRHKIDILREIAAYGMDGMFIDVLRHPLLVSYDEPVVQAYRERTGKDVRQLEGDGGEDWLRFRADATFTQFLREARAALDAQAGRRLPLYVRTVVEPWHNLHIGCDVETWFREGLLDGVIFGPHCADATNYPDFINLRPWIRLARETAGKTKVFGQVWRYGSALHAEVMAADLYEQGVDGVALYESNATVARPSLRENLWRYSRPECLRFGRRG